MGVKIVNRAYDGIYETGTTDWLVGNTGDWQVLTLSVEASIDYVATLQAPIQIDYVNKTFTLANGGNWGDYGFDIGMVMVLTYLYSKDEDNDGEFEYNVPYTYVYNIVNVYGATIEVSQELKTGFEMIPANLGFEKITNVKFAVNNRPEGCKLKYGHLTNENAPNAQLDSIIDGSTSEFIKPNILTGGVFQYMEGVGLQSGMSIRTVEIKSKGLKPETNNVFQYDIKIVFMISSFFQDLSSMTSKIAPDYLQGAGSLADNFLIQFFPEWNNPNVKIQNDTKKTVRLGNTGWFDENFNQLNNDFKIDSVEYFDLNGNKVSSLDYITQTKLKVVISGVPNLTSQTKCGFGFIWIPENDQSYKNNNNPFYRNTFVQSGKIDGSFDLNTLYPDTNFGAGVNGASMDTNNVRFTALGNTIVMEAVFIPNSKFTNIFDQKDANDRNYALWVSVGDSTLVPRNFSDRVSLLVDVNTLVKNIPVAGEYPYMDNRFIEHPFNETDAGVEVLEGITQDDFINRVTFRIKKNSSVFQKIEFGIEAYNIGSDLAYPLENYIIDLSQYPIDKNGVQQFNFSKSRGFKLGVNNPKNWVKVERSPSMDTVDFVGYIAYFATKIRWEDWLLRQNVPSDFYNVNEMNFGYNNNWIHYLRTSGFIINFYVKSDVLEDDVILQYKNQYRLKFVDYDENQLIQTTVAYIRDSDDVVLNIGTDPETGKPLGVILSNEPTRIEIDFEILDDGIWDITKNYAVITIEIDKGSGETEMRQLSSVDLPETDNPLIPLPGETLLKINVDGTNKVLTASCLVDPDLLTPAARYRITGRVGCLQDDSPPFDARLYEFKYEQIYE